MRQAMTPVTRKRMRFMSPEEERNNTRSYELESRQDRGRDDSREIGHLLENPERFGVENKGKREQYYWLCPSLLRCFIEGSYLRVNLVTRSDRKRHKTPHDIDI